MEKSRSSKKELKDSKKTQQQLQQNDISYWQMMINGIVRPPRAKYNNSHLGNKVIIFKERIYVREDYNVNHLGKILQLTMYVPGGTNVQAIPYTILYMHGNSSCKVQSLGLIKSLPKGVSLSSFDFMGCGKNQQTDTISLGYREAEQTKTIVEFLTALGFRVILWGRSMGAATALLYGKAKFIVADSSYKSFKSLCKQVAKQHSPVIVPNCMINCFFPCVFSKIKKDVDKKANYDVEDLDIRQAVKKLSPDTVIVFMSGDKDILVNKRNSQKLYIACPCTKKHLKIFSGDHNSKRPQSVMNEIMSLIEQFIKEDQISRKQILQNQIKLQVDNIF